MVLITSIFEVGKELINLVDKDLPASPYSNVHHGPLEFMNRLKMPIF